MSCFDTINQEISRQKSRLETDLASANINSADTNSGILALLDGIVVGPLAALLGGVAQSMVGAGEQQLAGAENLINEIVDSVVMLGPTIIDGFDLATKRRIALNLRDNLEARRIACNNILLALTDIRNIIMGFVYTFILDDNLDDIRAAYAYVTRALKHLNAAETFLDENRLNLFEVRQNVEIAHESVIRALEYLNYDIAAAGNIRNFMDNLFRPGGVPADEAREQLQDIISQYRETIGTIFQITKDRLFSDLRVIAENIPVTLPSTEMVGSENGRGSNFTNIGAINLGYYQGFINTLKIGVVPTTVSIKAGTSALLSFEEDFSNLTGISSRALDRLLSVYSKLQIVHSNMNSFLMDKELSGESVNEFRLALLRTEWTGLLTEIEVKLRADSALGSLVAQGAADEIQMEAYTDLLNWLGRKDENDQYIYHESLEGIIASLILWAEEDALKLIWGFTKAENRNKLFALTSNVLYELNEAIAMDGVLLSKVNNFISTVPDDIISDAENFISTISSYLSGTGRDSSACVIQIGMLPATLSHALTTNLDVAGQSAIALGGLGILADAAATNIKACFAEVGNKRAKLDERTLSSLLETDEQLQKEYDDRTILDNDNYSKFCKEVLESPTALVLPENGPYHKPDDAPQYSKDLTRGLP